MKKKLLIILLIFNTLCVFAQLTIRITSLPPNTPQNSTIYIAGSFNNWNPSDTSKIMRLQTDGSYSITFTPNVGQIQYKFTRGSWATVEGTEGGTFRANRTIQYNGLAQTIDNQIVGWEGLTGSNSTAAANVRIISTNFQMPQLGRSRRIWVYLPPNYTQDTTRRFSVIYMHDGQNLFDRATSFSGEWQVDESLNTLFQQGDRGCIVVGIDNGGNNRIGELTPWRNAQYGGGEGNLYARFVVETLKPYIDANFRTKSDRLNTAVAGSSLGGLESMYMAVEYPQVFSKAGIFSPSFWYSDSCFAQVRLRGRQPQYPMRFYFVAGTTESVGMMPDIQRMATTLQEVGYDTAAYVVVPKGDGAHSEWFWAREFPDAYKWLFREMPTKTAENPKIDKNEKPKKPYSDVKLVPNPASKMLDIQTAESLENTKIEIYSRWGVLVKTTDLMNETTIGLEGIASGTYLLKATRGKEVLFVQNFMVF